MGPARVIGCGPAYVRRAGEPGGPRARGDTGATRGQQFSETRRVTAGSDMTPRAVPSPQLSGRISPSRQRRKAEPELRVVRVRVPPPAPPDRLTDLRFPGWARPLVRAGSVQGWPGRPARRGQVPVGVQGDAGGGVAELALHGLDAGPLADHQRGGGVPQVVQPQVVGQRIGAAIGVELGDGLVGGSDGRLEAVRDELGLRSGPPRGAVNTSSSRPVGRPAR
jgi:hypothetical protein